MRARLVAALVSVIPALAYASEIKLGTHDVPSVFHIAKSENRNEVHFAVRLDGECDLASEDPVLAYWRDREVSESATSELLFLERRAYDLDDLERLGPQHARFVLRALPERPIDLEVSKRADGTCTSRAVAKVGGEPSRLRKVYAHLSGWSVDYIVIQAVRLRDGKLIEERVVP